MTTPTATAADRIPSRRRRRVLTGTAAAVGLLAALALAGWWLRSGGGPSEGPLRSPEASSIGARHHPGDRFGFGLGVAYNTGDQPAVLERIRLVNPTPGLKTIETAVSGPDRELLAFAHTNQWPSENFTDVQPVRGFTVAPMSQPDGERGVELLFGLQVDEVGTYEAKAIAIHYTVGGEEHVAYIRQGLRVCVVPETEPIKGDCDTPKGMNDPIED